MKKVNFYVLCIWFFFMLSFPSVFSEVKYMLIVLILGMYFFSFIKPSYKLKIRTYLILFTVVLVGLMYYFYGFLVLNKIDYKLFEIYIITPILTLIFASLLKNEFDFFSFINVLDLITLFILCYDVMIILSKFGVLPRFFDLESSIAGSYVFTNEKVEMRITNHTSLMFLLPVTITKIMLGNKLNGFLNHLRYLILIFAAMVTITSGRRALQLVFIISIISPFFYKYISHIKSNSKKRRKNRSLFWVIILFILFLFLFNYFASNLFGINNPLDSVFATFRRGFEFNTNQSANIKKVQTILLIEGWSEKPFFGHGIGTYLPNYVRSTKTPWSYEMMYFSMLYQLGIIGSGVYVFLIIVLLKNIINKIKARKKEKSVAYYSYFVGIICFLITGATNPMIFYLWFWVIFSATAFTRDDTKNDFIKRNVTEGYAG